jgi:alkylated DNA nucleotide flippase Atl1
MAGYSTTLRNARLDAITTAVGNAGKLQIYDGTQPATGGTATTKLAEFTLGSPFAPAASAGVLSPTLPSSTTGLAASTATWFRVVTSGGAFVLDGTAGTSGKELILNTASVAVGVNVSITSWTITTGNP